MSMATIDRDATYFVSILDRNLKTIYVGALGENCSIPGKEAVGTHIWDWTEDKSQKRELMSVSGEVLFTGETGIIRYRSGSGAPFEMIIDRFKCPYESEGFLLVAQSRLIRDDDADLTERELDVVRLICQDLTSCEIADALFISESTVEKHRASIRDKLDVKGTAGIVRYAVRHGLV